MAIQPDHKRTFVSSVDELVFTRVPSKEWVRCPGERCGKEIKLATIMSRPGFLCGKCLEDPKNANVWLLPCKGCSKRVGSNRVSILNDDGLCFQCVTSAKDKEILTIKAKLDETIVQYASLIARVNKALGGKLVLE